MLRPGYFAATVHGAAQQPARRRSGGAKKTTTTATAQKLSSCVTETVASRMRYLYVNVYSRVYIYGVYVMYYI